MDFSMVYSSYLVRLVHTYLYGYEHDDVIFIFRIRKEVQQVAGEEFCVWRWLPNNSLNKSPVQSTTCSSKKPKVWQGQAFETMEGSVNSLTCSPTPCLKIRHMFDPEM